jgi:hypothetical protein
VALLGVSLAGSCAVYDASTIARNPDGTPGGGDGDAGAGPSADPDGSGGQAPSPAADESQAGANDSAGNGGIAGTSGGGAWAGADSGAAGSRDGESPGGNGGAAGAPGDGGSAAGGTSCATGWRNQSACEQCATQTQPDLQACAVILDCYVSKSCGPSSCAGADQKCGPNVLREGAAAYGIAQDVYACMCK